MHWRCLFRFSGASSTTRLRGSRVRASSFCGSKVATNRGREITVRGGTGYFGPVGQTVPWHFCTVRLFSTVERKAPPFFPPHPRPHPPPCRIGGGRSGWSQVWVTASLPARDARSGRGGRPSRVRPAGREARDSFFRRGSTWTSGRG